MESINMRSLDSRIKSQDQALKLLKPYVNLFPGQDFGDGSIRNINERTVDDAYCVDVLSGEVFQCDEEMTLTPIICRYYK